MNGGQREAERWRDLSQVCGYLTDDGRVYHPSQITLLYKDDPVTLRRRSPEARLGWIAGKLEAGEITAADAAFLLRVEASEMTQ